MTALLTKKLTSEEDDIKVYEVFLAHNYPRFMGNYYLWEECTLIQDENINHSNLLKKFNALYGHIYTCQAHHIADVEKDYNFLVDYIF